MAIYIHKFQTENDFDSARANNYKEPWVSLTVSGKTAVDSFVINPEGTPITFYYLAGCAGNNDYRWSTMVEKLEITAVDQVEQTITASGLTFEYDGDECDNVFSWEGPEIPGDPQGWSYYGVTDTANPSVGDILTLVNISSSQEYIETDSAYLSVGDLVDYDGNETQIIEINQGGGELINRVDYNKDMRFTLRSGEWTWDGQQEKLLPTDVIETVFKVNVPASCEDVFDAMSHMIDEHTHYSIYVDDIRISEERIQTGGSDCDKVEDILGNIEMYDVQTQMFNQLLAGHIVDISYDDVE